MTLTDKQRAFIDEPNFAVVAVNDDRGHPRSTVVWVDRDGDTLRFNTTTARAKGRHLARGGYVSVLIVDEHNFHRWLEIQGPARLVEEGALEHIHALSHKYTGRDFANPQDRVTVLVTPERVNEYEL